MNYDTLTFANLIFTTIAFFFDIRSYKIPNRLTACGLLTGAAMQLITKGTAGILCFAGGALLPFLILFPLYRFRMIGAGDIKLLSLSGGFLSPEGSLTYMLYALVISGIFAVILTALSGNLIQRMDYFTSYIKSYAQGDRKPYIKYGDRPENFHLSAPFLICALLAAGRIIAL